MIQRLIEQVAPRVVAADAVRTLDETVTVTVGDGTWPTVSRSEGVGWHLRVHRDGRIGMAGALDDRLDGLVERALLSAAAGSGGPLHLPAPAPLPTVRTASPAAQVLGPGDLAGFAGQLVDRLWTSGRTVEAWAERSAGRVEVANTRGVLAGYDVTMVGIGVSVRATGPQGPGRCVVHHVGVDLPGSTDVERVVDEVNRRLQPMRVGDDLPPAVTVGLAPRAVASVLRMLEPAFSGQARRRQRALGADVLDWDLPSDLTVIDDPLVDGRPGSRPIDDDGVVSRRVTLVQDGAVQGWRCDLATGAEFGLPSTGHAVRTPFAEPHVGPSNTILLAGSADARNLAGLVGDGIVILDLPAGAGNIAAGRLSCRAPWAFGVSGGEVTGRIARLTIRDDLVAMLKRVRAVGRDLEWTGAVGAPALVLESVGVTTG